MQPEHRSLPAANGGRAAASLSGIVADVGFSELKRLLGIIGEQYDPLFASRRTICLVGPVNTGKSSLYNALVAAGAPEATVSAVPGTTRRSLTGNAAAFLVTDTPGANEAVVGGEGRAAGRQRHDDALASAAQADFLVMVFDAARGIAQDELAIYNELLDLGKPYVVALNKIDLVGRDRDAVVDAAAQSLQLGRHEIIATSAVRGAGLDRLLLAIVNADPQLVVTLSETLPNARWLLANRAILGASVAAGTANLMTSPVQIPFASFIPITAVQVGMVLSLARIFGLPMTARRARDVLVTFGSAILGRTLFRQLVDLVPVAGWLLGTAIAVGTTAALGYAVSTWFASGEKISREGVKEMSEVFSRTFAESFKKFPERGSLRANLQSIVVETLKLMEETAAQYKKPASR